MSSTPQASSNFLRTAYQARFHGGPVKATDKSGGASNGFSVMEFQKKLNGAEPTKENVTKALWDTLNAGQVVPGYGHAVLRKTDPRYMAQREFCLATPGLKDYPLFKVIAKIFSSLTDLILDRNWIRLVSTLVLPLPAPARISADCGGRVTASSCFSLRPVSRLSMAQNKNAWPISGRTHKTFLYQRELILLCHNPS